MPLIYRKTAKGLSEIETRANRLPPRLRSALIVVDGKRNLAELRPLILQPDETLAALAYAFLLRGQWPAPLTALGIALLVAGVLWALRIKPVRVAP